MYDVYISLDTVYVGVLYADGKRNVSTSKVRERSRGLIEKYG